MTAATFVQTYRWGICFRIRGYGASLVHDMPVMFSERVGKRRVYRAFGFAFQWLKP